MQFQLLSYCTLFKQDLIMKSTSPTQSPSRPHHSRDEEGRNLSSRLLELTQDKERQASRGSHQNYTDDLRESVSHRTSGRPSMQNTLLVQSSVAGPHTQIRPQSQPLNPLYPQFHPVNHPQNPRPLPNHQQLQPFPPQPIHPHNHFVVPGQFAPNWINQPQTTQARLEEARRTPFFAQPQQMVQSQRVVEASQMQLRRGMTPKQGYQHPPQSSPHKIMFNYNPNGTSQQPQLLTQSTISNQITQSRQLAPAVQNDRTESSLGWDQKYTRVVEVLEMHYTKWEVIRREYGLLQSNMEKTESPQQLHSLKQRSRELLNTIMQTDEELKEALGQNRQGQWTNWKARYDELLNQEKTKSIQREEEWSLKCQQVQQRLQEAYKQNQLHKQSNSALTDHYLIAQEQNEQLKQRIRDYQDKQHEYNNDGRDREMQQAISARDEEIGDLKMTIEQLSQSISSSVNARMAANNNLKVSVDLDQYNDQGQIIATLQDQNNSLSAVVVKNKQEYDEEIDRAKHKISIYEAELTKRTTEVTNCHLEIEQKQNTIQQLTKIQRQSNSGQIQAQIRRLKHEIRVREETQEADAKIFAARVQELIDKLKMVSMERDNLTLSSQEKINLLESDITKKDGTVRNLRDRILQLQEEKRLKEMEMKYSGKKSGISLDLSSELNSLKRQLSEKNNDIEELEGQMAEYKRITNQYEDRLNVKTHEINNLKRQLDANSNAQEQILKLTDLLNRRNVEIIQLKSLSFELEKMKGEHEMLRQENLNLKDSLKRKQEELCDFSDKVYVLEHHIREVESAKEKETAVKLDQEKQMLEAAVHSKDQEIAKLRQANQLLESNVEESEAELEKLKSKLTSGERLSESVNFELRNKLKVMEKEVAEYERKIGGLEEVKAILQDQVTTLTTQIHLKFQNDHNFQVELRQEQARAKTLESQFKSLLEQAEQLRSKGKELQKKNQILQKELQGEIELKKQATNSKKSEVFSLNNRLAEVQKSSKAKDSQIKDLEKTVEALNYKMRNLDNNIEEMEYLKHKITEYEVKTNMFSIQRPYSRATDLEPTQVFERKVIYKLKMENDALRKELGVSQGKQPEINHQNIPERDTNSQHVKERLNNFNQRLEDIIGHHFSTQLPDISDQLYQQFERDKAQLVQKHSAQIRGLHSVIEQLQQNQVRWQAAIPWQQYGAAGNEKRSVKMLDGIYNEQIQFYRQKNQELEERVDDHIRVNKDLKDHIASLIRNHADPHSLQYYKRQIEKGNETITLLQAKLKKAEQKSKEESVRSNSRVIVTDNYSFEAEAKTNELCRRINQLTLELKQAQKDKANEAQLMEEQEKERKKLKNQMEELKKWREQSLRNDRAKQSALQQEITRLELKLKTNQLETETLRDALDKRQYQHSQQLQDANAKLLQLQQQTNHSRAHLQQLTINLQKSQRELVKCQSQNKTLLSEVQTFKDMADASAKKTKQSQSQLQGARMKVSELQARLRMNNSNTEAFNFKQQQYREQTIKANNQIRLLQAEIQRLNQFSQRKLSEKDATIAKNKDSIDQHRQKIHQLEQRLDQMRIEAYRSNESTQTIYDLRDEISKLKLTLETRNSEAKERARQIEELRRCVEDAESQSRWVQNRTESNLNQMSQAYQQLQEQQRRLKQNNYDLSVQIETYKAQLSDKNHMNGELNSIITQLQDQITEVENQLQDLRTAKDNAESKILELKSDYCLLENQLRQAKYNSSKMIEVSSSVTISELNCTIVQLKQEIRTLNQNADNRIYELESDIQLLQDQLREARLANNNTNEVNQLRSTIAVLQHRLEQINRNEEAKFKQINEFNVRIIILESQLREVSTSKDAQLQLLQQLLNHSRYVIQFMRSSLIQVEILVSEDAIPRESLSLRVNEEIGKSLEECERWNQAQ